MDVLGTVRALAIDFARSELYFKSIENGPNVTRGMSMVSNPLDHFASAR
jgi:hypothetical protein